MIVKRQLWLCLFCNGTAHREGVPSSSLPIFPTAEFHVQRLIPFGTLCAVRYIDQNLFFVFFFLFPLRRFVNTPIRASPWEPSGSLFLCLGAPTTTTFFLGQQQLALAMKQTGGTCVKTTGTCCIESRLPVMLQHCVILHGCAWEPVTWLTNTPSERI